MSVLSVAEKHRRGRQRLEHNLAAYAKRLWRQVDPNRLTETWQPLSNRLLVALAAAQASAAGAADEYLDAVLAAQKLPTAAAGTVNAQALAGIAADGRDLASLLQRPVVATKLAVELGAPIDRAFATGGTALDMIVRTEVGDAGRIADQMATTAHEAAEGFTRLAVGKSCSRCVILAGRWYEWNAGFDRHPRCDCVHVPGRRDTNDVRTDPRAYFDTLTREEQDRTFTKAGAEAIREGADMNRTVNARRGMYTAGERKFTRDSTTRRGTGQRIRLMPEQIYRDARNREEAIRMLRENGYLIGRPTRPTLPAPTVPTPKPPVPSRPTVVAGPRTLATRVAEGVTARKRLSGGAAAKTELVTLRDGSRAVFKTAKPVRSIGPDIDPVLQQDAEELGAMLVRTVGVRVPEVHRATPDSVYMEFMDGRVGVKALSKEELAAFDRGDQVERFTSSDDGRLMGLIDIVMNNTDRNAGNWLVAADGRLVAIDHGMSFRYGPDASAAPRGLASNRGHLGTGGSPFAHHFLSGFGYQRGGRFVDRPDWLDNDMDPRDIALIRRRIVALRPQFAARGRLDWYDSALARLDQIGRHAKGTRRRLT